MLVDTFYRLFSHAALAFSCACLLEAEQQFLPAPEWAIPPVLVVIGLAFFLEGRWSLPDTAANVFAVLIAAGGVWWLVEQVYRPSGPVVLPLPTGLVPHLGPMIMALLLVKSFRPRRPADFWVLQGMGLLQVALACVLAADPHFGLLLAGYVVCGVTCLALRHAAGIERPDAERGTFPVAASRASFAVPVGPFLRRPFVWTPAIGILAGVLFLATPRGNWQSWDPLTRFGIRGSSFRASTGFAEEINLNGTGELELDDEVAFTVTAVDAANRPKTDLSPGTRWRGAVVENYRDGYWSSSDRARAGAALRRLRVAQEQLPSFGPAEYFLTFHVQPRRAGGLFLAEPILLGREPARLPVVGVDAAQPAPFYEFSGTVLPSNRVTRQEYVYRQVAAPVLVPDLVNAENLIFVEYARQLLAQPPERITAWTKERLQELARDNRYGLTAKDLDLDQTQKNDTGEPIPRSAERVARALCDYLALSGEFGYTLDQRREDLSADPAVDFLCNVHAGHCERYASGLTLMLRGCGIPARVVKGFRGAEHQADGVYVVRQSDAHAWVEALVPRPVSLTQAAQVWALAGTPRGNLFLAAALACGSEQVGCDWLVLDPTPTTAALPAQPFSLWRWCQNQWRRTDVLWREMVLDFNSDQQADLWNGLTGPRGFGRALLQALTVGAGGVLLAWGVVWVLRRLPRWWTRLRAVRQPGPAPPPWLARLYGLLARHLGVGPEPGRTARETATVAAAALGAHPAAAPLADIPGRVVELYYRSRFGSRPPDDAENRLVDEELSRLEAALRTSFGAP